MAQVSNVREVGRIEQFEVGRGNRIGQVGQHPNGTHITQHDIRTPNLGSGWC